MTICSTILVSDTTTDTSNGKIPSGLMTDLARGPAVLLLYLFIYLFRIVFIYLIVYYFILSRVRISQSNFPNLTFNNKP